jgi:alkyl sulfatase BDS1-like metallo-beta-lactamase superfamily hydrolase
VKRSKLFIFVGLTAALFTFSSCTGGKTGTPLDASAKEATKTTQDKNKEVYALLDFSDEQEKSFAEKGLIAAPESLELKDEKGKVVWSQKAYSFVENADAPATVNPSLWRNTQLNHLYGLFEVADGIYQVRGYDMTNITFIKGDTGWIVFDPLMSTECSAAAMQLVNENLGERPVTAVVMSHPHVDHYGGIKGIISEEEVASRNIPIIVPEGFEEHAVSENVYAGNAMGRRAGYQYGTILDDSATGSMSIGIGMGQSTGTISYISPNDTIKQTGETRTVDGVTMEFQLTPGTEAPVEMNTWFADKKALWIAENCTGTLHNLYTLRGAQIRDGNAWAEYIMEAMTRYGKDAEVVFQSHNWPHWGNDVINRYLENTAAMYKFINDQTLMYINQGYTSDEISNMITLPESLEKNWYTRQYYGTVAHNAKAVYQKYMGWYDANPVNLNPLTPSDSAKKYVEYMGDTGEVLKKARVDFDKGEYQWVAEITNVLVFADPDNQEARYLCADALEQLGYQAESGTWRNAYLSGAKELREGTITDTALKANSSADLKKSMTPEMMMDYMGILTDSNAAQDVNLKINLNFTDTDPYLLRVDSGVLLYQKGVQADDADATLTLPRVAMFTILNKDEAKQQETIRIEGDQDILKKLTEHMVTFEYFFNIVEP